jgi:hypothetical protein
MVCGNLGKLGGLVVEVRWIADEQPAEKTKVFVPPL